MENKNVLIGMSGGVDSSVAAFILKNQGYNVNGVMLNFFDNNSKESIDDAKSVCADLGIEFYNFDCKKEFKTHVIDDFISCYSKCMTPNPCIECNRYMKFGYIFNIAKDLRM